MTSLRFRGNHACDMRAALARLAAIPGTLLLTVLAVACANNAVAPHDDITPPSDTEAFTIYPNPGEDIALKGTLFGAGNAPLVILTHMRPNDQTAWFPYAQQLAADGFAAFTFDFRGHGESTGEEDFEALDDDLTAVIEYMRSRDMNDILLVGASMGATTALVVAEENGVNGVVALSPPSEFEGQDAVAAVATLEAPKLFLVSEDDAPTLLFDELYTAAIEEKEQEIYPGNLHGTDLIDPAKNENAANVEERITGFLEDLR